MPARAQAPAAMTTKYGMFSEHPATAGTPVVPLTKLKAGEERPTDRDGHGLNMKAGTTKLGKVTRGQPRPWQCTRGGSHVGPHAHAHMRTHTHGRSCTHAQGNDATFGRFLPLHEGDKYVDPLRLQLKAKAAARGKNVTGAPPRVPLKWGRGRQ